jgi:hypothetical protein
MKWLIALLLLVGARASADGLPYRLWWSFPGDDANAIEIDDADLGGSRFESRWQLALALRPRCGRAPKKAEREVRVEQLDDDGEVRGVARCRASLGDFRKRLGERMVERLEDELDAHVSFIAPRKMPQTDWDRMSKSIRHRTGAGAGAGAGTGTGAGAGAGSETGAVRGTDQPRKRTISSPPGQQAPVGDFPPPPVPPIATEKKE